MTLEVAAEPILDVDLRDWIPRHRVCWQTIVHRDIGPDGLMSVGFDVVLSARCVGPGAWDPGSDRALLIFEHLRQLASAVIPPDCPDDVRVGPFEPTFQVRPQSDWEPEIRLVIEIRHDHEYFAAIDDDERTCVRRLERALERWGAQRDAWPSTRKIRA
jgi:hypothetical protein